MLTVQSVRSAAAPGGMLRWAAALETRLALGADASLAGGGACGHVGKYYGNMRVKRRKAKKYGANWRAK